ncbi:MAG: hypothetical protein Q9195_006501 [Heterodermia aff. obscurata]
MAIRKTIDDQRRICSYLGLRCTHRLSILSLPPIVRHQIYEEADIITDCDLDLAPLSDTESSDYETEFEATFHLLQTSRTIYKEVSSYVYSTNRFYIHYRTQCSLQPLRDLSPDALASLRHLTIHLNVTSCEAGHPCCNAYPGQAKSCNDHDQPLDLSTKRGKAILDEWALTAAYTFAHIRPSTLNFHLVCDVSTLEAAQLILAPLSTAPLLASCAIRLARKPDTTLQTLARDTAATITAPGSQINPAPPFPFLLLPREVRKHILSFTDLVSPLQEIQYSIKKAYHLQYSTWCCGKEDCPPHLHRACARRNCWQRAPGKIGCFCSVVHAAFWTECRCWSPPTSIFLISTGMRILAREVFFAENRFVMVPDGGARNVVDRLPEQIHAEKFLKEMVPRDAMKYLRTLELVFPPFQTPSISPFKEWEDTLEAVRENLNVPKLTIRVCFADERPYREPGSQDEKFRLIMTKKEAVQIFGSYLRIVTPLRQLEGLGRLFVKIAWPWEWTEQGRWRRQQKRDRVQREVENAEWRIERIVMGEEYESGGVGKGKMGASQWMLDGEGYG